MHGMKSCLQRTLKQSDVSKYTYFFLDALNIIDSIVYSIYFYFTEYLNIEDITVHVYAVCYRKAPWPILGAS